MYKRMTKSAYNRLACTGTPAHRHRCDAAVRFGQPRCIFRPFTRGGRGRPGCIDRIDTITRASFLRVFFSPSPTSPSLPTAPKKPLLSRTISTAAFDVPFARDRRTVLSTCVYLRASERARVSYHHRFYAIHFLFYTHFSIPHTHTHTSYHAPLTTAMSIIWRFCRNLLALPRFALGWSTNCVAVNVAIENARRATRLFSSILNRRVIIEPLLK